MKVPGQGNEIVAGLRILKQLPLKGAVMTGDAIYAQKRICDETSRPEGGYFFVVKDNQRELKRDIQDSFNFFSPRTSQASRI